MCVWGGGGGQGAGGGGGSRVGQQYSQDITSQGMIDF